MTKVPLVLFLPLIGLEIGANFLDQSDSTVKQNQYNRYVQRSTRNCCIVLCKTISFYFLVICYVNIAQNVEEFQVSHDKKLKAFIPNHNNNQFYL